MSGSYPYHRCRQCLNVFLIAPTRGWSPYLTRNQTIKFCPGCGSTDFTQVPNEVALSKDTDDRGVIRAFWIFISDATNIPINILEAAYSVWEPPPDGTDNPNFQEWIKGGMQ